MPVESSFVVQLLCAGQLKQGVSVAADIVLPWSFSDPDNMDLYYMQDGVRTSINRTVIDVGGDPTLSARIRTGIEYFAITEYIIDLIAQDEIGLGIASNVLCAGQELTITYTVPVGKTVTSIYVLLDNGERVELAASSSGSVSFTMPACRITVGAKVENIIYTVIFMSSNGVLSSNKYTYGQMPVIPPDPDKENDGVYEYKFIGWDKAVTAVTESVTYFAQYEEKLIPLEPEAPWWEIFHFSDSVWNKIHKAAKIGVPVFIVIFIFIPALLLSSVTALISFTAKIRKRR